MQYLITFTYQDGEIFKEATDLKFKTNHMNFRGDYIVIFGKKMYVFDTKNITNLIIKGVAE